jgi:hypothetical protein
MEAHMLVMNVKRDEKTRKEKLKETIDDKIMKSQFKYECVMPRSVL